MWRLEPDSVMTADMQGELWVVDGKTTMPAANKSLSLTDDVTDPSSLMLLKIPQRQKRDYMISNASNEENEVKNDGIPQKQNSYDNYYLNQLINHKHNK